MPSLRNLAVPLCLLAVAAPLIAQQPANKDWNAAGDVWWSHVRVLADDKLEGRGTGTPGYETAAKYVEDQFKATGLKPAGINGYRQDVELVPLMLDKENSVFQVSNTTFSLSDVSMRMAFPCEGAPGTSGASVH